METVPRAFRQDRAVGRIVAPGALATLGLVVVVFGNESAALRSPGMLAALALAVGGLGLAAARARGTLAAALPDLSPRGLGLFRIAWGLALLAALGDLEGRLPSVAVPRDLLKTTTTTDLGASGWLAENPDAVRAIVACVVVALLFFVAGAAARLVYAVAALGFAALAHLLVAAQGGAHNWGLPVVAILLLVLAPWSRSGVGVDETIRRLRGRDGGERTATPLGLALWLPGLALGVAWLAAAYAKLDASGLEWVTGGAVRYHFVEDALAAPVDWGSWIASHPRVAIGFAAAGILFELTFIANVFFRSPLIRLAFGLSGLAFLSGTLLFQGVRWFPWWLVLLGFVPWEPIARGLRAALPESVVLIDGGCPLCRRTASILHSLDWFDRLTFADANDAAAARRWAPGRDREEILISMAVVRPADRRVLLGYDGYVALAAGVPVLWPFAILGPLPPVRWLGRRVYAAVAARRNRDGCTDETCRTRVLSSRVLPRPAADPVQGPLALGVCALLAVFLVAQVVASDRRLEREPIVSNYPMYSSTFASPAAFDGARERKLSRYRLEIGGRDRSSAVAAIGGIEPILDLAYALKDGAGRSPELLAPLATLRVAYLKEYGTELGRVTVRIDQRAFDWRQGKFVWKRMNAVLAELDLRRGSLL